MSGVRRMGHGAIDTREVSVSVSEDDVDSARFLIASPSQHLSDETICFWTSHHSYIDRSSDHLCE
jgi:hypothetical protein